MKNETKRERYAAYAVWNNTDLKDRPVYFRGYTAATRYYRKIAAGPQSGNLYAAGITARCGGCQAWTVDAEREDSRPCPVCGKDS